MGIRTTLLSVICLALAAAPSAFAAPKAPAAKPAPPPAAETIAAAKAADKAAGQAEYVLGPEDVIDIEVVGQADKAHARVYSDGTIQMNLIGKLQAGGKTTRVLGDEIAAALKAGGYYSSPVVNIEVASYAARYVTVLGAVGQPGLVPINRPYRLSEIMARVGGVREGAADYLTVRPDAGPERRYRIETLATGDNDQDPYATPGDKIFVPIAEVFYISGSITQPGTYPLRSDMTLRQAIARGGGLSESGTDHGVLVTRGGKRLKLDASAKVEPNDVIVIRERLF
jgi:polysaccharide export outer membrane protein